MTKPANLTEAQRRAVRCPKCNAAVGDPCWRGPRPLRREHEERSEIARSRVAALATPRSDDTMDIPAGLGTLGRSAAEATLSAADAETLALWGRRATTGGCRAFYTPDEWRAKGWEVADNAVVVIVHDGGDLKRIHTSEGMGRAWVDSLNKLGLRFERAEHVVTTVHTDE